MEFLAEAKDVYPLIGRYSCYKAEQYMKLYGVQYTVGYDWLTSTMFGNLEPFSFSFNF